MRGEGPWAEQIQQMFKLTTQRLGLNERSYKLSTAHFRRPAARTQFPLQFQFDSNRAAEEGRRLKTPAIHERLIFVKGRMLKLIPPPAAGRIPLFCRRGG
jgi:hypothetical protein